MATSMHVLLSVTRYRGGDAGAVSSLWFSMDRILCCKEEERFGRLCSRHHTSYAVTEFTVSCYNTQLF